MPGSLSSLVGVADEVREPAGVGVDVHAGIEDVGAVPEDLLRAVALVGVDVDDGDPLVPGGAQSLGRRCGVVEVAGPAEEGRAGVMSRWPHRGVGGTGAVGDEVGGVHRGVDRAACGVERPLADQCHRVHGVQADLGADRRRAPFRHVPAGERRSGEQVGHDVGLTGVLEVPFGDP